MTVYCVTTNITNSKHTSSLTLEYKGVKSSFRVRRPMPPATAYKPLVIEWNATCTWPEVSFRGSKS